MDGETSALLFLRPTLVSDQYRSAKSQTGQNWSDLVRLAKEPDWPGYFGAPRLATAARGAADAGAFLKTATEYALKILGGFDDRMVGRIGELTKKTPQNVAIDSDALSREEESRRRQERWLAKRGGLR
jgi:hypothetical protein